MTVRIHIRIDGDAKACFEKLTRLRNALDRFRVDNSVTLLSDCAQAATGYFVAASLAARRHERYHAKARRRKGRKRL